MRVLVGIALYALATLLGVTSGLASQAAAAEPPAAWTGPGIDAVAATAGGINVSVGPGRMVLEGPVGGGSATTALTIHVTAPIRARVTATLADVGLGSDGLPVRAPLGSTDWTLGDVATLTGNAFDYRPAYDQATFTVTVTAHAPAFEQPRMGVVVVTAAPADGGGEAATVMAVILSGPDTASAAAVADTAPMLSADTIAITRAPWTQLDAALANPWRRLLDHGHATLTWQYENIGDAAGMTVTTIEVYELGPLGWLPFVHDAGTHVRTIVTEERLVLPGQQVTETLASDLAAAPPQPAWSLPDVGVVRVVFRTTSGIAGLHAAPGSETLVLVIAPWKEIAACAGLALLAVLLLRLVGVVLRRVRSRRRRAVTSSVQTYVPVSAISERTEPVLRRGRFGPSGPTPPPEPAEPREPPEPPASATLATPNRRAGAGNAGAGAPAPATRQPLHAPPPKSGTPTV